MHRTPRCQGQLWREVWRYRYTCCINLVTWISSPPIPLTSTSKSCISTWEQLSPSRNSNSKEEGHKAYYDQKASHYELSVGDEVWYYSCVQPRQNAPIACQIIARFLPHWTGPHEIVDKLSPVAYWIKLRQGHSKPVHRWVHRNQMKRHQGSSWQKNWEDQTHWHRLTIIRSTPH